MKYEKIANGRKTSIIKGAAAFKISDIKQCGNPFCKEKVKYIIYRTERYTSGDTPELKPEHMFSCGKHLNKVLEGRENAWYLNQISLCGLEMLCVENER